MRNAGVLCLLSVALALPTTGSAQPKDEFPNRAVRVVLGTAPGGGLEFVARTISEKLSLMWKVPVVIDNQPGANQATASQLVAGLQPDGYSLLFVSMAYGINPSMYKLRFDPITDLKPIIQVTSAPYVVSIDASVPSQSVAELIEYAKRKPGSLNYSSAGVGSPGHLATELFSRAAGISMVHVPYKGSAPATTALLGGEVQVYFGSPATVARALSTGRVRALAVTSPKRTSMLPDLPTVDETGLRGYSVVGWYGFLAPSKVPAARIAMINEAVGKVLQMPDVIARLQKDGADPAGGTPEDFTKLVASEIVRWKEVITRADIKPE